jgi:hypothetical protein
VRIPILMVNGRWDFVLPYETSQVPLFNLLGTPDADKKHQLVDGQHMLLRTQDRIREVLNWLDKYLGPVEPGVPQQPTPGT